MLEIKHLTKVYRPKKGAPVCALNDVSVRFPEKGMVFVLGKSGSGKSTLLNLCGGLDTPDAGEIVVKGRSSKDFSAADFDSYRNTLVGFVFQEYNILDEFTVEDNIALALELQGKGKSRERVHDILEQVDLAGYAKRKPGTLSGGQKQRVAIARALVKNPEIIMADEPTGALDSATGRQVLETLRRLSIDKLIIVVSHDREFAELYGDRIIELQDGKIVSDMTKERVPPVTASENVRLIGDGILSIRSGCALSADEMQAIRSFIAASPQDVIISNGKREIADFKKAAHIGDDGAKEQFMQTREQDIRTRQYTVAENRFIRSKLPARHAARIGASSMRVKPFRLAFTIFLAFIAFALFGLFSTLTFYDPAETAVRTYLDAGYETLRLENNYRYTEIYFLGQEEQDRFESSSRTQFTPADIEKLRDRFGSTLLGFYDYSEPGYAVSLFGIRNTGSLNYSSYYSTTLQGFAELSPSASSYWQDLLLTDTDLSSLDAGDIVITAYTFASLQRAGLTDENGEEIALDTYDDILGHTLAFSSNGNEDVLLTVRGVLDIVPPARYDAILVSRDVEERNDLLNQLKSELDCGLYSVGFVCPDFYETHRAEFADGSSHSADYFYYHLASRISATGERSTAFSFTDVSSLPPAYGTASDEVAFFDGRTQLSLGEGEIVLNFSALDSCVQQMAQAKCAEIAAVNSEAAAEEARRTLERDIDILRNGSYTEYEYDEEGEEVGSRRMNADKEQIQAALETILALMEQYEGTDYAADTAVTLRTSAGTSLGEYTVAGFLYGYTAGDTMAVYFSESDCLGLVGTVGTGNLAVSVEQTSYVKPDDARYNAAILLSPATESEMRALIRAAGQIGEDDAFFTVQSPVSDNLRFIDTFVEMFSQVFLWLGIVMAVFAILLLFNFISVSISYKKREIGILRAVGARSTDVFKIFYAESAIIAVICFALSMVACFIVCMILNATLAGQIGISAFVFGPLSWLVMLGIAAVTSLIATFLPVYGIARKKPVESIRAL